MESHKIPWFQTTNQTSSDFRMILSNQEIVFGELMLTLRTCENTT